MGRRGPAYGLGQRGGGSGVGYREFFRTLTGYDPLPYQERLAEVLGEGRSVILRAPTGAGKTWAVVAPFLHGMTAGRPLADRLLYALPLRSLATSLHSKTLTSMRKCTHWFGSVLATGKDRDYQDSTKACSLQIGGESNDPFFESEVVFTTIDQLLSGYLMVPVALPDRLANINAGALIGAQVAFDEAHLLDPERALGTVVEMLDRTRPYSQFVMMTATLSTDGMEWLAGKLGGDAITLSQDEVRELPSQRTKERTWRWAGCELTPQAIQNAHQGGRTIVLVNTVARAQGLYRGLRRSYEEQATKVLLLHSRFYAHDRKRIEQAVEHYFGPESTSSDVILVTTQVIEAGLDISGDCLHTEVAPMNSLIQRAGRVARYEQRNQGVVIVYACERLGPYRDQKGIVEATSEILKEIDPAGEIIDFVREQVWVDRVHRLQELAQLTAYESLKPVRDRVHEAMRGERGRLSDLVRNSQSVNVLVTSQPDSVNFSGRDAAGRRIGWPLMLSVPAVSLLALARFFDGLKPGAWIAKGAIDSESGTGFDWTSVEAGPQFFRQWLVAVHPDYALYSAEIGLLLGKAGAERPLLYSELAPLPRYQYEFEPWTEHAERVVLQARRMSRNYRWATETLAESFGVEARAVEELAELAAALHDLGKLCAGWQQEAWRWQRERDRQLRLEGHEVPDRPSVPLAHTSFDPRSDRGLQRELGIRLPNHAVEGAYAAECAVTKMITEMLGERYGLVASRAVISVVARHHSPWARKLDLFRLVQGAAECVQRVTGKALEDQGFTDCRSRLDAAEFGRCLFDPALHGEVWALYTFLSRRLRLADQGAVRARI